MGGRRSFLCVPSLGSTRDGTPSPLPWGPGQQTLSWDLLHSLISEDALVGEDRLGQRGGAGSHGGRGAAGSDTGSS